MSPVRPVAWALAAAAWVPWVALALALSGCGGQLAVPNAASPCAYTPTCKVVAPATKTTVPFWRCACVEPEVSP